METIIENNMPVVLTKNAINEVKDLLAKGNYEQSFGLRLGVKGGGCAGFSYILDFDSQKNNDLSFNIDNVNIYIDKSQAIYLQNCEIDFKNGLDNRGFIFNNPNASSTCGCGTSFSA